MIPLHVTVLSVPTLAFANVPDPLAVAVTASLPTFPVNVTVVPQVALVVPSYCLSFALTAAVNVFAVIFAVFVALVLLN